ncbi:hypothetical protein PJL15_04149 [Paenarthrobacter nitroguajacolicus]|nr:hypothetical protein [Paenarthrobacter nitroguajacolicus]
MVLIPRDSGTPPPVSFTETARADAAHDAARLLESADALSTAGGPDAKNQGLADLVTLLTTHAQALAAPADAPGLRPTSTSPAAATTEASDDATATRASLLEQLSGSGRKRLADAREADGGIARLLAAVGTSQLVHAETLAAAWQLPLPGDTTPANNTPPANNTTVPAAAPTAAACPSVSPTPDPSSATTDSALAAAVRSQQEAVYAYQVALKRLDDAVATAAAKDLQAHLLLLRQAEALTRANCGDVPATTAGYQLPTLFAQDPAAALGALETSALPGYGDLVALSTDETRQWAVDGLLSAARRSIAWGATLPALPGLKLDAGELPPLPTSAPASSTGRATNAG